MSHRVLIRRRGAEVCRPLPDIVEDGRRAQQPRPDGGYRSNSKHASDDGQQINPGPGRCFVRPYGPPPPCAFYRSRNVTGAAARASDLFAEGLGSAAVWRRFQRPNPNPIHGPNGNAIRWSWMPA